MALHQDKTPKSHEPSPKNISTKVYVSEEKLNWYSYPKLQTHTEPQEGLSHDHVFTNSTSFELLDSSLFGT